MSSFDLLTYVETRCVVARRGAKGEFVLRECPNCGARNHCSVNPERQKWRCFKCGWAGHEPLKFVAKVESVSFAAARAIMLETALDHRQPDEIEKLAQDETEVEKPAKPGWRDMMPPEYIPCYDKARGKWNGIPVYLKQRGITKASCLAYRLGWCDTGQYARRIIIPIVTGELASFQARATWETSKHEAKYDTPTGAPLSRMLMGYEMMRAGAELWVVEGPFDAIACFQAGIPAVPLTGKELSDAQANLISKLKPSRVHVMLDPEAEVQTRQVAGKLSYRCPTDIVLLDGGDPNEIERDDLFKQAHNFRELGRSRLATVLSKKRIASST
jgi:DNA primase